MNREVHVRICERLGVKFPGPTRHLQPSCAVTTDGSLSPDSFRARRILLAAESGQYRTSVRLRAWRSGNSDLGQGPHAARTQRDRCKSARVRAHQFAGVAAGELEKQQVRRGIIENTRKDSGQPEVSQVVR